MYNILNKSNNLLPPHRGAGGPNFVYWLTVALLMLPNVALCFTEGLSFMACLTNIVLPLGVYMWLMTLATKPGKMIWALFPLIFFAAFQLVLLYLFGQGIIAVDMFLNVITTNAGEVFELLDNLIPAVAGVFIIYIPLLAIGVASIRSNAIAAQPLKRHRKKSFWIMATGCVFLAVSCLSDKSYRILNNLYPLNACYNLCLAVDRSWVSAHYKETSADFKFHSRSTHPTDSAEVYVMVVGETARAHNFGLYGYKRNTTPLLEKTPGVVAFSNAVTQSNTTHKSVPMLLSAATADNYSRLYKEQGILSAFREAGFYTAFFSNQLPNHSFIDFLGGQADTCVFMKTTKPQNTNVYDGELLTMVNNLLTQGRRKVFIVLHTYGSHFEYRERYPESMAYYRPDSLSEAKFENRENLLNAYDNTIRYTDNVLHRLTQILEIHGGLCAMLYTSDHGENIFDDDRRLFLHASPKASEYELRVPLIVWQSDSHRQQFPSIAAALKNNRTKQVQTSISAFHTMLTLGGISTPIADSTASVASMSYRPRELQYLTDHNEPIPMKIDE